MKCHDDSETSFVFIADKSSTSEIEPTVDDIDETVKSLPSDHLGLPQMKTALLPEETFEQLPKSVSNKKTELYSQPGNPKQHFLKPQRLHWV